MKEITINIPDESSELVIELVERLGGSVDRSTAERFSKMKRNVSLSKKKKGDQLALLGKHTGLDLEKGGNKQKNKVAQSSKKTKKEKIDHTYLFGKWNDFDIDIKKIREELWRGI
jgi:hypothetical protein